MSNFLSIDGSVAFSARNQRKNPRFSSRGYFNNWSRYESDLLRREIASILTAKTSLPIQSLQTDDFEFFSTVPVPNFCNDRPSEVDIALLQLRALYSKSPDLDSGINTQEVAFQKFMECERSCKSINDQFRLESISHEARIILHYASQKIASILGICPRFEQLDMTFGPGASSLTTDGKTSARWKLTNSPNVNPNFVRSGLFRQIDEIVPLWFQETGTITVSYGRLGFVPKNHKTDRPIVIEPSLTGMIQKGIGTHIKNKLLKAGINLYDQSINRQRALRASRDGSLATIDLSSASDTISYNLVAELLPLDWYILLDSVRTDKVHYKTTLIELEKFSSMGNGYTFELESLLFFALSFGIAKYRKINFDLSVYGDDLICNPDLALEIERLFPLFGFSVNSEKSFSSGHFRESCGFDAWSGILVRPFFLKKRFSFHLVVCFINFLTANEIFDIDGRIRRLLLRSLPSRYRLRGPAGYGDGHIVVHQPVLQHHKRSRGWGGFTFDTFVSVPFTDHSEASGDSLFPAYSAGSLEPPSETQFHLRIPSGNFVRHKKVRVYTFG